MNIYPLDIGHILNAQKTFKRRPGHLLNVLRMLNISPVPRVFEYN